MGERAARRIRRPGHLALAVVDLERAVDFYTRVVRMVVSERSEGCVYLRTQWEHHSLDLRAAAAPGVRHLGWETWSDAETQALRAHLAAAGVALREAPDEPGRLGEAFEFQDAGGMWNQVYRTMERMAALVCDAAFPRLTLGHFTRLSADPDGELNFFRQAGFRVSDWLPGRQAFLRCNDEHHNLGLLGFTQNRLHHHAYEVADWEAVRRVLDGVTQAGWPVEVGPVRHAPANNVTVYIRDPDAFRVEFYCEMEHLPDDDDHDRRRQPLVFDLWHGGKPPEGFRD